MWVSLARLFAVVTAIFLSGCSFFINIDTMTESDLYGMWQNLDGTTYRVLVFKAQDDTGSADLEGYTNVYWIYIYEQGGEPVLVQRGTFFKETVSDIPALVTTAIYNTLSPFQGMRYSNEILEFSARRLVLHSTTSSTFEREFTRASNFPL